jgi:hypothetical protein
MLNCILPITKEDQRIIFSYLKCYTSDVRKIKYLKIRILNVLCFYIKEAFTKRNYFKTETDNVTKDSPRFDTVECA